MATERSQLTFGATVYTEDGTKIGQIRGIDEDGLYISLRDGIQGLSVEHVRSGQQFGEAELMWRCWECGEMGRLEDDVPDECPNCGAEREELYYWTED
ncbi:DUF7130 family rubredoxin-like protein [Halopiger xanaduensis]|uniref:Small CPxCG-related zinc finger protein n=1 Tax=Halopiger xanaduensis (strain DSM 18323 / JCM 14033 / SH-6) TaxID=797210 RepID=F8D2Y7_HALXS|nr:hypothetical protein [Halopiger xanaduensis]AEH36135.1 small CPxCG-related zinc finger protein [Halopiger xanaduensis SH-6]